MIDSQMDDMIRDKLALKEQVDSLKQNLSKQIKEKECLLQTFMVFKNESKEKEDEYMENEIDLEKKIKELDNILFKMGQSAQTVHMLTKLQAFYDNIHKQALCYQNLFHLKKVQRIKPTLYNGIVMSDKHVVMLVIDDEETLILEEISRSKMSEKEKDPEIINKNISHKPIDYEKVNRLSKDFGKRFTPQQEMDAEQAFWLRISNPISKPSDASSIKIEAPKKLPKVSLVNESLKKLKFHLARFDNVVKIRTTPDARTEGEWGFEHTKAVFNNEIIPFLKSLKDIFNVFDRDLLNEILEVHTVFNQMDTVVQHFPVDKQCLKIAKKELLLENDRLLKQIMSQEVPLTVMNSMSLISESLNMDGNRKESCNLEAELLKSQNTFNDLLKRHSQLEKHYISLECSIQLNQEIFQKRESCDNQNALEIPEFLKNNDLKAQLHDKDSTICKLKDIIKSLREKSKEENVNYDYCEIETKNLDMENRKEIVAIAAQIPSANIIIPGIFKLDLEPLDPRLLQNREAHINYLKYTQEQANILWGIVEQAKAAQPLDKELDFALPKRLMSHTKTMSRKLGLKCSTSKCGSKPTGNKRNDRILQTPSRNMKNKLNANPDLNCATCKKSLFDDVHDKCLLDFVKNVNTYAKFAKKHKKQNIWRPTGYVFTEVGLKWKPTGRTFTIVGCLDCSLLDSRTTILQELWGMVTISWEMLLFQGYTTSRVLDKTCFLLVNFATGILKSHFGKNTCFIHNLEGVDLLSGSHDTNVYTISLDDMLKTSLIYLLSKASKTKSWLWHRRLSHLNFGTINKLAKDGLARDIPRFKFQKNRLCSACALGKSKKSSHQPKAKDTNQEKLYLLHMDLYGPMRVARINGKRYILVIVDDYSRFTWVRFLRTKDKAPEAIIKCIKNIQVRLNATVLNVQTDNGTKFVNQTLREFYENVGITHQTSVDHTP
ncbi:retrovirus-related pol polyprotein from transposon TNT 1-94 [Tanacetum coccineum]